MTVGMPARVAAVVVAAVAVVAVSAGRFHLRMARRESCVSDARAVMEADSLAVDFPTRLTARSDPAREVGAQRTCSARVHLLVKDAGAVAGAFGVFGAWDVAEEGRGLRLLVAPRPRSTRLAADRYLCSSSPRSPAYSYECVCAVCAVAARSSFLANVYGDARLPSSRSAGSTATRHSTPAARNMEV